jgi:hypothetical protein
MIASPKLPGRSGQEARGLTGKLTRLYRACLTVERATTALQQEFDRPRIVGELAPYRGKSLVERGP